VNRSEKISLTIAAVVSGVLPNGNLVIQGTQEVRTNAELRQLTVAGIVRPEDISSANTIKHTQIAEARISYGGRGDISRVQKTPWRPGAGREILAVLRTWALRRVDRTSLIRADARGPRLAGVTAFARTRRALDPGADPMSKTRSRPFRPGRRRRAGDHFF
jgi:hypothetical protein